MFNLDNFLRAMFQNVYDVLLDEYGVRIGSFRVAIALAPLVTDWSMRIAAGEPPATMAFSAFIVGLIMHHFYSLRAMRIDNHLQSQNRLSEINAASEKFQTRTLKIRIFYLILFGASSVVLHKFDGFALLDIVFARCIKVRPRIRREQHAPMPSRWAHA